VSSIIGYEIAEERLTVIVCAAWFEHMVRAKRGESTVAVEENKFLLLDAYMVFLSN
jgi:hypothetical protein